MVACFASVAGLLTPSLYAQKKAFHIKGRVTNESGQPVAKATIMVKSSTTGVSSDDNGQF